MHTVLSPQLLHEFLSEREGMIQGVSWSWEYKPGGGFAHLTGHNWSVQGQFHQGSFVQGRVVLDRALIEGEFYEETGVVFGRLRSGNFRFSNGGVAKLNFAEGSLVQGTYFNWCSGVGPVSFSETEAREGPGFAGENRILSPYCFREGRGWPIITGVAYSPRGLFLHNFDFSQAVFPRLQALLGLELAAEELRGQLNREQLEMLGDGPALGYTLTLRVRGVGERCVLVVDDPSRPQVGWGALFSSPPVRFSLFVSEGRAKLETGLRLHSPEAFADLLRQRETLSPPKAEVFQSDKAFLDNQLASESVKGDNSSLSACRPRTESPPLPRKLQDDCCGKAQNALEDLRQENTMLLSINCSLKRFCTEREEEFRAQLATQVNRVSALEKELAEIRSMPSYEVVDELPTETFLFEGDKNGQGELTWPAERVSLRGLFSDGLFVAGEARWGAFLFTGSLVQNKLQGPGTIADEGLTLHAKWEENCLPDQRAEVTLRDEGVVVDAACEVKGEQLLCDNGQVYRIKSQTGRFELNA